MDPSVKVIVTAVAVPLGVKVVLLAEEIDIPGKSDGNDRDSLPHAYVPADESKVTACELFLAIA